MNNKIISAEKAAKLISSNSTIAISGNGELVLPDFILSAIEKRYIEEQQPKNLNLIFPIVLGAINEGRGADHLAHDGLVKSLISSSLYTLNVRKINQMLIDDKITGHHLPMGTVFRIIQARAAGEQGFLTKVGLNSFVDPRSEGGRINASTKIPLSQVVKIDEEEFLYYPSPPIDISIIRGTTADEYGNISYEEEAMTSGVLSMAMAAKSSGGKTIAQVKYLTKAGTIHPKSVVIPAPLVDYIVVYPEQQEEFELCDPSFTGKVRKPLGDIDILPMSASKIIVRRAALELEKGKLYNLGVGIPADLPLIIVEENLVDSIFFSVEHGPVGGVPYDKRQFGASYNPLAVLDTTKALDMYDGGCLDGAFLGLAQLDESGSVNVSRINGFLNVGGFMDIVHRTPKIFFCGTFTSGGLKIDLSNAKLKIKKEGKYRKMVKDVNQKSFDGRLAIEKSQKALYITERAVFELNRKGVRLLEVAPGINIQKDVLEKMDFVPQIAEPVKIMDTRCFINKPMGLKLE